MVEEHDHDAYLCFGREARVYPLAKVVAPQNVFIDDFAVISDFAFVLGTGHVTLGKYVHLAPYAMISGGGRVRVGDFSELSYGSKIISGSDDIYGPHLFTPGVPAELRRVERSFVEIGEMCVIGTNAVVYPGVRIGNGVIVAPGTIVKQSLEAWHLYEGPDCTCLGKRRHEQELTETARSLLARGRPSEKRA